MSPIRLFPPLPPTSAGESGLRRTSAHSPARGLAFLALCLLTVSSTRGQNLRYDNHREVQVPDYAVLRIGPFYSNLAFTQSAGYRWTQGRGSGTDFTFANRRGVITDDGSDLPLISTLDMRNYLVLTEHMDIDLSVRFRYEHYPMETQEDDFYITLPEEGVDGNLSTTFQLTPYVRGTWREDFLYRTDYVDTRGVEDVFGGSRYEYLRNILGLNLDWLMTKRQNFGITVSRRDEVPIEDEFEEQEYVRYNEVFSYGYSVSPGLVIGARATLSQIEYASTNRSDADVQDFSVFLSGAKSDRIELTELTTLEAAIGVSAGHTRSEGSITNSVLGSDDSYESGTDMVSGLLALETRLRRDLRHRISYQRAIQSSFNTAFQSVSLYGYEITWKGDVATVGLFTRLNEIDPSSELYSGYSDWTTGVNATYRLTKRVKLNLSSAYTQRDNSSRSQSAVSATDTRTAQQVVEQDNDYNTWVSRLGTGCGITKKINFSTYVQHTERESESENLDYERDMFSAAFTYKHVF